MRYSSILRICLLLAVGAAPAALSAQNPTFASAKAIPSFLPTGYSSAVFLAGNFNGNGNTDLIVTTSNSIYGPFTNEFLSGDGTGKFTQTGTVTNIPNGNAWLVADVNGDGKDDVIILMGGCEELPCNNWPDEGNADGIFTVMLSQGNGKFIQSDLDTLPSGLAGVHGVVGDFNKDGKPDIAVLSYTSDLSSFAEWAIFLNNGDGTFTQSDHLTTDLLSFGIDATNLVVGDFEGNGNQDLALAFTSTNGGPVKSPEIITFAGDGKGNFGPGVVKYTLTGYSFAGTSWPLFASDLNGDGHADLAITLEGPGPKFATTTISLLTDSQGRFHWGSAVALAASNPFTLFSDLNGDAHPDLFYITQGSSGSTTENAGIYLGTATGAFKTPHVAVTVPGTGDQFSVIAAPLKTGALPSLFVSGAKSVALEFINTTK